MRQHRLRFAGMAAAVAAAALCLASFAGASAAAARTHAADAAHAAASGGTWGKAEEVPGTAALNKGTQTHDAQLQSLSCASAGNCSAAGSYQNDTGQHVFVVSETNGSWGKAREAPGTSALGDSIGSLSCGSAGNCSAVGPGFVIDQVNGTWQKAEAIPGLAALNQGGDTKSDSVSCASAGRCSAGGYYDDASGQQAFVVNER